MQTARIISNPRIMMGKPVIAGTRLTIESIIEKLAAGRRSTRFRKPIRG